MLISSVMYVLSTEVKESVQNQGMVVSSGLEKNVGGSNANSITNC